MSKVYYDKNYNYEDINTETGFCEHTIATVAVVEGAVVDRTRSNAGGM